MDIFGDSLLYLQATLNPVTCDITNSAFPLNQGVNSKYLDVGACHSGDYFLYVSTLTLSQSASVTITVTPCSLIDDTTDASVSAPCPRCCSNIGRCLSNGTCQCPTTWTGSDCSIPVPTNNTSTVCTLTMSNFVLSVKSLSLLAKNSLFCSSIREKIDWIDNYILTNELPREVTCEARRDYVCKV